MTQQDMNQQDMTRQKLDYEFWRHSQQSWMTHLVSSPARCHALGGFALLALIATNAWIWADSSELLPEDFHRQREISVSAELIASENHHQTQLEIAKRQEDLNQARIDQIQSWLPRERQWDDVRSDVQTLCAEMNLQLLTIQPGREQLGARVAVLAGECEIQGSYLDIFRFVRSLPKRNHPIECIAIGITDTEKGSDSNAQSETEQAALCQAKISIRAPLVGKGTTADKLLKELDRARTKQPAPIELNI